MDRTAAHVLQLALANASGSGGAPQWVQLLPLGTWKGADGRGPYTLSRERAATIIAAVGGQPLALDYDHATDLAAPEGRPAPAAGWIEQLELRESDGAPGVWGRVAWTERGGAAIAAKEWRFISPVFLHAKDGAITRLLRASLTNNPNFDLVALASAGTGRNRGAADGAQGEDSMDLLQALIALFNLTKDATAEQIAAHAQKLVADLTTAGAQLGEIAKAAGVAADAKAVDVIKAVAAAVAKGTPDPAQFVAAASFNQLAEQVKSLTGEIAKRDATAAVDAAITGGKLIPAQRDWALALHQRDPKEFATFIAAQPQIVAPGASGPSGAPAAGAGGLAAEELAVASALGLTADQFKAAKQ